MRMAALASFFLGMVLGSNRVVLGGGGLPESPVEGTGRALIIVGLPGDPAHESLFRSTIASWREWLVGPLGFAPGEVRVFSGTRVEPGRASLPATRESIAAEVESIRSRSSANDRLWVFVLGHANLDEGHAFLHLPGPDILDHEFAALFRDIPGREQVFWMTTAASGAFVKPLAKPGRIVIAATEPEGESNETEFPHALAEVGRRVPERLDLDKDGQVSLLEIFEATVEAVEARFAADKRAPTEHARIDDDGDGVGTELKATEKPPRPDGSLASKTILMKARPTPPATPPPRSENGTKPVVPPAR
jgi:hypothetical protein